MAMAQTQEHWWGALHVEWEDPVAINGNDW